MSTEYPDRSRKGGPYISARDKVRLRRMIIDGRPSSGELEAAQIVEFAKHELASHWMDTRLVAPLMFVASLLLTGFLFGGINLLVAAGTTVGYVTVANWWRTLLQGVASRPRDWKAQT